MTLTAWCFWWWVMREFSGWPFSLLNNEQTSNWLGVEYQPANWMRESNLMKRWRAIFEGFFLRQNSALNLDWCPIITPKICSKRNIWWNLSTEAKSLWFHLEIAGTGVCNALDILFIDPWAVLVSAQPRPTFKALGDDTLFTVVGKLKFKTLL